MYFTNKKKTKTKYQAIHQNKQTNKQTNKHKNKFQSYMSDLLYTYTYCCYVMVYRLQQCCYFHELVPPGSVQHLSLKAII